MAPGPRSGDPLEAPLAGQRPGPVLVGFSGGLDSTVLLHLLQADAPTRAGGLRALHVDHGLHPGAARWADACVAAGRRWGIEVTVAAVRVDARGLGREGAAREARRAAFAAALAPGETLALAHHRDDQAETVLLRLLRASGVDGLAAMSVDATFAGGRLWRPLLDVPRAALLAHARRHGLDWLEDPANADDEHDRNFLRHAVLPLLRTRWPHADAALARSAGLAGEASALLRAEDLRVLDAARTDDPRVLSISTLAASPRARTARVLRAWIAQRSLPPLPARGVDWALAQIDRRGAGHFAWSGAVLACWRAHLHAAPARPALPPGMCLPWDGSGRLGLPGGDRLEFLAGDGPRVPAAMAGAPFTVRARLGGERIQLPGRTHSHALKHVLQDAGIAPWDRVRLPLLFAADGALEAAGDGVLSSRLDAWLRHRGARLRWHRDGRPAGPGDVTEPGPIA